MVLQASGVGTRYGETNDPFPMARLIVGNVDPNGPNSPHDVGAYFSYLGTNPCHSHLWISDSTILLECNLDDMTGEALAHVVDVLLRHGALDAWVTPIVMKKGRPAHTLHCMSPSGPDAHTEDGQGIPQKLLELIFRHTTTLGVRIQPNVPRAKLTRNIVTVRTPFGKTTTEGRGNVRVKIGQFRGSEEILSAKAEFDDCQEISLATGVPLSTIADHAVRKCLLGPSSTTRGAKRRTANGEDYEEEEEEVAIADESSIGQSEVLLMSQEETSTLGGYDEDSA